MKKNKIQEQLTPLFGEAKQVCSAIHDDRQFTIKLMRRDPSTRIVSDVKYVHGTYDELCEKFDGWKEKGLEVFVMVGKTDGDGLKASNVTSTRAVAVDFDNGFDKAYWEGSPYAPTLVIETSKNRYHCIWKLREQANVEEFAAMISAIAIRFNGDVCFGNVTQAVRLPGFQNQKYGSDVTLDSTFGASRSYDIGQLCKAFDVSLVTSYFNRHGPSGRESVNPAADAANDESLMADINDALSHIPADTYNGWIGVGMALAPLGDTGFACWDEWSRSSKKYNKGIMTKKWDSFGAGGTTSIKTIFYRAAQHGWKNPGYRKSDIGRAVDTLTDRDLGRSIAQAMGDDFTVNRVDGKGKATVQFLQWNDFKYAPLDDIQRRRCIEQELKKIIQNSPNKDVIRSLKQKIGTNSGLDNLSEHVAEFKLHDAATRDASAYPYFAMANGVMNLMTGVFVPAFLRPLSKYHSPVIYDAKAEAPRFRQFMKEIFEGDKEMCNYVMRLFGHIMLGNPVEHLFVVFYGKGGNGKSKLVNILRYILGAYAGSLPTTAIMAKSHVTDSATPALAKLPGKRLAVISEPNGKHQIDAGMIKNLTGGEHVTARALFGETKDFLPECVPLMLTNEKPGVRDDDEGLWRRLNIVSFNRKFEGAAIDVHLEDKLLREASGIFNILLKGAQDYLRGGLRPPAKVTSITNEMRKEVDPFEEFFNECLIADETKDTAFKSISATYQTWQKENPQFRRLTVIEMGKKLEARNFRKDLRRNYPWYAGVAVRRFAGHSI